MNESKPKRRAGQQRVRQQQVQDVIHGGKTIGNRGCGQIHFRIETFDWWGWRHRRGGFPQARARAVFPLIVAGGGDHPVWLGEFFRPLLVFWPMACRPACGHNGRLEAGVTLAGGDGLGKGIAVGNSGQPAHHPIISKSLALPAIVYG